MLDLVGTLLTSWNKQQQQQQQQHQDALKGKWEETLVVVSPVRSENESKWKLGKKCIQMEEKEDTSGTTMKSLLDEGFHYWTF